MEKQYNLNEILEKLFKTGKIKKDEIWCVKDYIERLKNENEVLDRNIDALVDYIHDLEIQISELKEGD